MPAYLERIPVDILQHIAFLSASSSTFDPPADIRSLLLTNRTISGSLSVHHCPHLYAKIFCTKFDLAAPRRRFLHSMTTSALAAELVQRYRTLRRIRLFEIPEPDIRQDLWTVLGMVLENDGLNEAHLRAAGFSQFIVAFLRARFCRNTLSWPLVDDVKSLALWLLSLTLTRCDIESQTVGLRGELLALLRPFVVPLSRRSSFKTSTLPRTDSPYWTVHDQFAVNHDTERGGVVVHYSQRRSLSCPHPSPAAIILTFALSEATPLQVPSHFAPTRAIAISEHRVGPTMEDYHAMEQCKTPLLADMYPKFCFDCQAEDASLVLSRSITLERDYHRMMPVPSVNASYVPGMLTGLWEGSILMTPVYSPGAPPELVSNAPFSCRKAIQCNMSEYLCFSPNVPLLAENVRENGDDDDFLNLNPSRLVQSSDGFEIRSKKFRYEKYVHATNTPQALKSQRDPYQALDVILTGETLRVHEQAWGGYKWAGKVRLNDGLIVINREPQNPEDDGLGTWIFEGHIHYSSVFVGRWRSSPTFDSCGLQGIFSMHKTTDG